MTACLHERLCLQVKQRQEEEKRQLVSLRDQLRPVVHTEQVRDIDAGPDWNYNTIQQVTYSTRVCVGLFT